MTSIVVRIEIMQYAMSHSSGQSGCASFIHIHDSRSTIIWIWRMDIHWITLKTLIYPSIHLLSYPLSSLDKGVWHYVVTKGTQYLWSNAFGTTSSFAGDRESWKHSNQACDELCSSTLQSPRMHMSLRIESRSKCSRRCSCEGLQSEPHCHQSSS
jgi:hypothetical protein